MDANELNAKGNAILAEIKKMMMTTGQVTQYIGARYQPLFATPIEWDDEREYEPLTVVMYQGDSYTSRQFVPKGIRIADAHYWAITGNFNAQIEKYREEVINLKNQMEAFEGALTTESNNRTTADNNIIKTINDNSNGIVNLASYGIRSDDSFDNSEIIKKAINENAGKVIILPNGRYAISETIDISNECQFICFGTLVATAPFNGEYVVTINKNFINQTVDNMTSFKHHIINIDCNDIATLNGLNYSHCYRCHIEANILNCALIGVTNGFPETIGNAENKVDVTVYNNTTNTNSVALKTVIPDDVFNLHAMEVNTAAICEATCEFEYAHVWLRYSTMWNTSTMFKTSTSIIANIVKSDTMRILVDSVGDSLFEASNVTVYINDYIVPKQISDENPTIISKGTGCKLVIRTYLDSSKNTLSDKDFVSPNSTMIGTTYPVEYIGDVLKMPEGTFFINGKSNVTNMPELTTEGSWCLAEVKNGHGYNYIKITAQSDNEVWIRTTAPDGKWVKL